MGKKIWLGGRHGGNRGKREEAEAGEDGFNCVKRPGGCLKGKGPMYRYLSQASRVSGAGMEG